MSMADRMAKYFRWYLMQTSSLRSGMAGYEPMGADEFHDVQTQLKVMVLTWDVARG